LFLRAAKIDGEYEIKNTSLKSVILLVSLFIRAFSKALNDALNESIKKELHEWSPISV